MSTSIRSILWKICCGAFFLFLAFKVSFAPVGHFDPPGSRYTAPLLILLCGMIVVAGKWKKAHVHFAWGCFTLTVFLSTYRLYCYHKMNDEIQRDQMMREAEAMEAARTGKK